MRLAILGTVLLGLAAAAYGQEAPNLVVKTPSPAALFVLDGSVALDSLSPGGGVFHLPKDPIATTFTSLDRYRLVGYTPQSVRLEPGKHRFYVVVDDSPIKVDVELGTDQQVWEVRPPSSFVKWTSGFLFLYGFFAVPFAVGPTYVDAAHGKGFSGGAIALTSGTAALALSLWGFIANVPSVNRVAQ